MCPMNFAPMIRALKVFYRKEINIVQVTAFNKPKFGFISMNNT